MFVTVALLMFVALASADQYEDAFLNFMQTHQRSYEHHEFQKRFEVFRDNYDFVQRHNADPSKTHTVALNQFADLTADEFAAIYNGVKVRQSLFFFVLSFCLFLFCLLLSLTA